MKDVGVQVTEFNRFLGNAQTKCRSDTRHIGVRTLRPFYSVVGCVVVLFSVAIAKTFVVIFTLNHCRFAVKLEKIMLGLFILLL